MNRPLEGRLIGFVGIGRMGRAMCRRLHAAGARLTLYNRTRAAAAALAAELPGSELAESPAALAGRVEALVVNVSDTAAVEEVLLASAGVVAGLRPGTLVIDMGTTAVSATRRFAAAVEARGGLYADAPVSGGVAGAEGATLAIMAGGSDEAFARAKPILVRLGKNVTHCGGTGAGQVAKAANQMIVGLTIAAVAEAFALARRAGVDPAKLREALAGGFAESRILEHHGQRMIEGDFAPGGRVALHRKDIRQALDLAGEVGLSLPVTEINLRLWDRMIERGWGQLDHSALIKLYEE